MIIRNEDPSVYESGRATHLTSHSLKEFTKSPSEYKRIKDGEVKWEYKAHFVEGEAIDVAVLDGKDAYFDQFKIEPLTNPRTGKSYGIGTKTYQKHVKPIQEETGKKCITPEVHNVAMLAVKKCLHRCHEAASLLRDGMPQVVIRRNYFDIPSQSKLDWLRNDNVIVDLKSVAGMNRFESQIEEYGYKNQLAFYRSMIEAELGEGACPSVHVVAFDKLGDNEVKVFNFTRSEIDREVRYNDAAVKKLSMCISSGYFPNKINISPTGRIVASRPPVPPPSRKKAKRRKVQPLF